MKKIFLAVFITTIAYTLCTTTVDARPHAKHGTRVNIGAHADLGGASLGLVVQYVNPSDIPITIKELKIYRPDGTEVSPNFSGILFPDPPFDLGPFEAKGFHLDGAGIQPVTWPPIGVFQVHTTWETDRVATSLKSFSVVITISPDGEVSKHAVEGFDLPARKPKKD